MTELALTMRAEQMKEDELEKTISELKKQSKKRPGEVENNMLANRVTRESGEI